MDHRRTPTQRPCSIKRVSRIMEDQRDHNCGPALAIPAYRISSCQSITSGTSTTGREPLVNLLELTAMPGISVTAHKAGTPPHSRTANGLPRSVLRSSPQPSTQLHRQRVLKVHQ